jgi:AraC family transcriptional regulator
METHLERTLGVSELGTSRSREWMRRLIRRLEATASQLQELRNPAQSKLLEAASLLRQQIHPSAERGIADGGLRLQPWQSRRVHDYIGAHITGPVRVKDLCALIQRSEAYFSRCFKRTFGESPHVFVIRRRLDFAAHYMLHTDASLSDIALRCGFSDQAHFCKQFRRAVGQTPAAWRRAHRVDGAVDLTRPPVAG